MDPAMLVSLILVIGLLCSFGFAILMLGAAAGRSSDGWQDTGRRAQPARARRSAVPTRPVRRASEHEVPHRSGSRVAGDAAAR